MDAKLRYKSQKKLKSSFFDIDDTLRAKENWIDPRICQRSLSSIERKKESGQGLQPAEGFLGLFLKSWT